ncbi:hypothetical protein SELMODRAFT_418707 [Selaginella moellendorffii]|uniref:Uncharacterized protein n=1 Tax=Selaginella moellendorffii TaxID=88036 RepID=D8S6W6_SELML|nr:hypothetical protein SELMODRAFT_418707 [Selaginella moellendorffii]
MQLQGIALDSIALICLRVPSPAPDKRMLTCLLSEIQCLKLRRILFFDSKCDDRQRVGSRETTPRSGKLKLKFETMTKKLGVLPDRVRVGRDECLSSFALQYDLVLGVLRTMLELEYHPPVKVWSAKTRPEKTENLTNIEQPLQRLRNLERAEQLWELMSAEAGVELAVVSYNTLINGYLEAGDNEQALIVFLQHACQGFSTNPFRILERHQGFANVRSFFETNTSSSVIPSEPARSTVVFEKQTGYQKSIFKKRPLDPWSPDETRSLAWIYRTCRIDPAQERRAHAVVLAPSFHWLPLMPVRRRSPGSTEIIWPLLWIDRKPALPLGARFMNCGEQKRFACRVKGDFLHGKIFLSYGIFRKKMGTSWRRGRYAAQQFVYAAYTRYGKVAEVSEIYKEGPGVEIAADYVGEKRAGRRDVPGRGFHARAAAKELFDSMGARIPGAGTRSRGHMRRRPAIRVVVGLYFSCWRRGSLVKKWELYYGPKSKKLNVTFTMILLLLEEQQTSRGESKDVKVCVNFGQNQFVFDVEEHEKHQAEVENIPALCLDTFYIQKTWQARH